MNRFLAVLLAALVITGCSTAVPDKAVETVEAVAAGNDRYAALATQALAGTADPGSGVAPITSAHLSATPAPVRLLLKRLLESLHVNRFAAHSVLYQLDRGPDPKGTIKPVQLPEVEVQ